MIMCSDDTKIHLPVKDATLDQYREQGRVVGAAYFEWYWADTRERNAKGIVVDAEWDYLDFCNVYLAGLNDKMQPVFNPTEEQFQAFNNEAGNEFLRQMQIEGRFWQALTDATKALAGELTIAKLLSSTAVRPTK